MDVDFIGKASVCSFISQTGLNQFVIQKVGAAKNSTPLFTFTDNKTTGKAVEEFSKFANAINPTQPYEMFLFNNIDELNEEEGATSYEKRKKSKMVRFTFQLKEDKAQADISDPKALFAGLVNEFKQEQSNNALLAEIRELKAKIDNIEEEEEEEEEEANPTILGGFTLRDVDGILARLAAYGIIKPPVQQQAAPTLAGEQATQSELDIKKANIEKAINILYQYDPQLDTDLLKLASIAEKQRPIFDMVITQLRNM